MRYHDNRQCQQRYMPSSSRLLTIVAMATIFQQQRRHHLVFMENDLKLRYGFRHQRGL